MGCDMSQNPNDPNVLPSVGSIPIVTSNQQNIQNNSQGPSQPKVQIREIKIEKKQQIRKKEENESQEQENSESSSDSSSSSDLLGKINIIRIEKSKKPSYDESSSNNDSDDSSN